MRKKIIAEYCPLYRCVYDKDGYCRFMESECDRPIKDDRCTHSGLYLRCLHAFWDGDTLVCGADRSTTQTKRYVKGLPEHKYEKKLAVSDLPSCLKDLIFGKSTWTEL
jgi:hypothetical protein